MHAINRQLDNIADRRLRRTVEAATTDQLGSLSELVERMRNREVSLLVILGGNPVYNAPAELDFARACESVGFRVHLSGLLMRPRSSRIGTYLSHTNSSHGATHGPLTARPPFNNR